MADLEKTSELPLENEGSLSDGSSLEISGKGEGRTKSSKLKTKNTKNFRKKKRDEPGARDPKKARGERSADKKGKHKSHKAGSENDAGHSRQGLQSGQTTVQFSSGGGVGAGNVNMAASLGSLLGLFASSAALARAEGGSILNTSNLSTNLVLRGAFQTSGNSSGNFFAEDGKSKNIAEAGETKVLEGAISKFAVDTGTGGNTHGGIASLADIVARLITGANAFGAELKGAGEHAPPPSFAFSQGTGGVAFIPPFNASGLFSSPTIRFTFSNSTLDAPAGTGPGGVPIFSLTSSYNVGYYLADASAVGGFSLVPVSSYGYQLSSPLVAGVNTPPSTFSSGMTITSANSGLDLTPLGFTVSGAPAGLITTATSGLTLTKSGDVYINALTPVSALIYITSAGNPTVPVRINVGPGVEISSPNYSYLPGHIIGNYTGTPFQSKVLDNYASPTTPYTIIGTDVGLQISSGSIRTLTHLHSLPSSGIYEFAPNTIYEHVGTGNYWIAEQVAYGNFANVGFSGGGVITLPTASSVPSSYTLTMGGNVLDVFGTKYGVADILNVVLPVNAAPPVGVTLPTNTLILGGNTLAGFGTAFGDLQELTITSQNGNSPTTLGTTAIVFRSNVLAVDKNIGSELYPHLQTLNMEQETSPSGTLVAPANVQITFGNSIIQGNVVAKNSIIGDTFYGDIQNLSTPGDLTAYQGFSKGLSITNRNGHVMTTTMDGNNNSISWGNNIYTGGIVANAVASGNIAKNDYNFTLLLDGGNHQAVMQGNALITNFNLTTDRLTFQISPSLFRALDGGDGQGHDKILTVGDLNNAVRFSALSLSSLQAIDPLFSEYLSQRSAGASLTGTTISFDGGNGGSISLVGTSLTSFGSISNLNVSNLNSLVKFTYVPVAALPLSQINATSSAQMSNPIVPGQGMFLYGQKADPNTASYYNELDNFFSDSVFATYSVAGVPSAQSSLTPRVPTAVQYNIAPGVIMDQFGTISVNKTATSPVLTPLTITATDQNGGTDTTTQLFGFLFAPTTVVADRGTTVGVNTLSSSNIIVGGLGSTLVGGKTDTGNLSLLGVANTPITAQKPTFGSNLIVDTKGGESVYGDFQNIAFGGTGASNTTLSDGGSLIQPGQFNSNVVTFADNAFYTLKAAATFGVAQNFSLSAQGGQNVTVSVGHHASPLTFMADGEANTNTFTFGNQTIYGSALSGGGSIYGSLENLNISSIAGNNAILVQTGGQGNGGSGAVSLDLSSHVDGNKFIFGNVHTIVTGDAVSDTTTLYSNVANLSLTLGPTSSISSGSSLSLTMSATFSGNSFTFGNANLKGGVGNTIFYSDVNLNTNKSLLSYTGFIDGVTLQNGPTGMVTTTTTDGKNNTITWGNDTLTGGQGTNTYNFTMLYNPTGTISPSGADSHLVFRGHDTITNFKPSTDRLVLTLQPKLWDELLATAGQPLTASVTASELDTAATFVYDGAKTTIYFNAPGGVSNGTLTLNGYYNSFTDLDSRANVVINKATVYATYNVNAIFDPVFVNGSRSAFSTFLSNSTDPTLNYSGNLPDGVTLDSHSGALTINTTGFMDIDIAGVTVTTPDGVIPLPAVHIFALGDPAATSVIKSSSSTFIGSSTPAAYVVTSAIVQGAGLSQTLVNSSSSYGSHLINNTSTVAHTIYGDFPTVSNNSSVSITNQTFTFSPNLMNIYQGGSDQIFGNIQQVALSLANGESSSFSNNSFVFGTTGLTGFGLLYTGNGAYNWGPTISGNTVYGYGTLYGTAQTITLNESSLDTNAVIRGNTMVFGGNTLTNGAYLNGTNVLTSASGTTLYGNAATLLITGSNVGQITNNTFVFGDNVLKGGLASTNFYGDLNDFKNFYGGVTVSSTPNSRGENFLSIMDNRGNTITWGNDTYLGGTAGNNTYHFTIVGQTRTSVPVMQGFDTIMNFNLASDKLVFTLPAALYLSLAGAGGTLTSKAFLSGLTFQQQDPTSLKLSFQGGGSLLLNGLTSIPDANTLANNVTIVTTSSGNAVPNPTSPMVIFGNTATTNTWSSLFTTVDPLSATLPISDTHLADKIIFNADGTVNFGANTGIINVKVPTVTVNDLGTTLTSNTSASNPVRILGLNGTLIDQPIGITEQGGTQANVFIGHGNTIIGGGSDLVYGTSITPSNAYVLTNPLPSNYQAATLASGTIVTNPSSTITYGSKLIYDVAPAPTNAVVGDVKNITLNATSLNDAIFNGGAANGNGIVKNASIIMSDNYIEIVPTSSATNFDAQATYGNTQHISLSATGGQNIYNVTVSTDNATVQNNTVTTGNNTITAPGTLYGEGQDITLTATDGFYANQASPAPSSAPVNLAQILGNSFAIGNMTLTATGTGAHFLYGDLKSITLQIAPADTSLESAAFKNALASSSGLQIGSSQIDNNTFQFGHNTLTGGLGTSSLYMGIDRLTIQNNEPVSLPGTQPVLSQITGNKFIFQDSSLNAIGGTTNFYEEVNDFSHTNFSYYGVNVTNIGGHVQITDTAGTGIFNAHNTTVSGNTITFGNDTMTGSTAAGSVNVFNLNLLATTSGSVVAEGNTTINNFGAPGVSNANMLNLQLSQALYNDIIAANNITQGSPVTATMLDAYITSHNGNIVQGNGDTTIYFSDGSGNNTGSIKLTGVTYDNLADLGSNLTITYQKVVPYPASPIVIFGNTANTDTWSSVFTTIDPLSATLPTADTHLADKITFNADRTVNFGANTGIVNVTVPTVTVNDLGTSLVSDTSANNPVRILGLNGTLIDQPAGVVEQGGTQANVFIGHGNAITGGGSDLVYGVSVAPADAFVLTDPLPSDYLTAVPATGMIVTNPASTLTYGSKLIYDVASTPTNAVVGDVKNITLNATSLNDAIFNGASADGSGAIKDTSITMADNYIEVVPASSATNFDAQATYGNTQHISLSATGGQNIYNVTTSTDNATIQNNTITTGNNTLIAPGVLYGEGQDITLRATDGFYADQASPAPSSTSVNLAQILGNNFIAGNMNLSAIGVGLHFLYGDLKSVTLQVSPADTSLESTAFISALSSSSGLQIGSSEIENNTFEFGHNALIGGVGTSFLYTSIDKLIIQNDEPASLPGTQITPSQITGNTFIFQDSSLKATGGTTNFYEEVNDFSHTNYFYYGVNATNTGGHVQITDTAGTGVFKPYDNMVSGNVITFGNDTMTGSSTSGSANIFHINLLGTTSGNMVAEGNTTINNFGSPGASNTNMLDLQLSQSLYNAVLTANGLPTGGAPVPITGSMLDAYLASHNGSITQQNGNTIINFSDGTGSNHNFGSITLTGVSLPGNHLSDLGANLEISAKGITTIDPLTSPSNIYHMDISGNTASAYAQNTHIVDFSSLGKIVDFGGTLNLNMSDTFYKALGLSDSNTAAQNFQALQNGVNTTTGGIAVSSTTTGAGADTITNTTLTFESTVNGQINTYGSITLYNTHFTAADPLSAHLQVTHHS